MTVHGRGEPPLVFPGLSYIIGATEDDVERSRRAIFDNLVLEIRRGQLKEIDIDLIDPALDGPLPEFPTHSEKHRTALEGYRALARDGGPYTVRQFLQKVAFREEYGGATVRDHLGLARPDNVFTH